MILILLYRQPADLFNRRQRIHLYSKYVFSTTENVSLNSSNLFTLIGPSTLIECGIDWNNFSLDKIDDVKIEPQKKPKPHQENAINDVIKGFETNSRGKLIMACGTGKTFTSLMIVEELYKKEKTRINLLMFYI